MTFLTTAQRIHAEFGTDTITNIENVIGTGKSDYIKGNDASNLIEGRGGNDYLIGLDGADTFKGGDGEDTIDFSDGGGTVIVDMTKEQTVGDATTYRVQNDGYASANKEYIDVELKILLQVQAMILCMEMNLETA